MNKRRILKLMLVLSLLTTTARSHAAPATRGDDFPQKKIIGVKIYDPVPDLPGLFNAWGRLGINTAFVSVGLAENKEFMELARARRIPVFVIIPVFYNPEELARHPDGYAVTGAGQPAKSDWVEFVCPNRPEYRRQRLDEISQLIQKCKPDGLSIDFIRYFAFWEMVYPGAILDPRQNTCFCSLCQQAMTAEKTIALPSDHRGWPAASDWIMQNRRSEWARWKCGIIASMAREIAAAARAQKPDILLNIHLVPWRERDFADAQHTVVSQDVPSLAASVDYLSPMCYAHMAKRPAGWIHEVAEDLCRQSAKPILPSIQVAEEYITDKLTARDFSDYLREALSPPSQGVIFWNWIALAGDPEKMEIVRTGCGAFATIEKSQL